MAKKLIQAGWAIRNVQDPNKWGSWLYSVKARADGAANDSAQDYYPQNRYEGAIALYAMEGEVLPRSIPADQLTHLTGAINMAAQLEYQFKDVPDEFKECLQNMKRVLNLVRKQQVVLRAIEKQERKAAKLNKEKS
jgi:hypothetical protein